MQNDKILLLDLLSLTRVVAAEAIAGIADERWQILLDMAAMHRVEPLLYWRLVKERQLPLPQAVAERLQGSYRQATFRSLQIQAELGALAKIFTREKIDYMVLKGPSLAYAVYPNSGLRPMRDIDILVSKEKIRHVYQILIDSGYQHLEHCENVNSTSHLELTKHYPGLVKNNGTVMLELHPRVLDPQLRRGKDPVQDSSLWTDCEFLTIGGQSIPVMSATDLLLHLIIHGCHDHQFNNGPLLMSDITFLLQSRIIDWARFWSLADEYQVIRGCLLTLCMVEYYQGIQQIEWPEEGHSQLEKLTPLVPELSLLMLQNFNLRVEQDRLAGWGADSSLTRKFVFLREKFFPAPERLGLFYAVSKDSPMLWFYYLLNCGRILKKFPIYWRVNNSQEGDTLTIARLKDWLADEAK